MCYTFKRPLFRQAAFHPPPHKCGSDRSLPSTWCLTYTGSSRCVCVWGGGGGGRRRVPSLCNRQCHKHRSLWLMYTIRLWSYMLRVQVAHSLFSQVQSVSAIAWVFDSCKSITISGASLQAIWTVYTHVHGHHVHQNDQCAAGSHLTYTVHDTWNGCPRALGNACCAASLTSAVVRVVKSFRSLCSPDEIKTLCCSSLVILFLYHYTRSFFAVISMVWFCDAIIIPDILL